MLYLDTSLLVAALTNEARTELIQAWLADQPIQKLVISDWVITEFSAALSIKLRREQLTIHNRADALALFTSLTTESFTRLPVSSRDFIVAARFADQFATGLRAGDALHLAVASNHGARLITLDKRLASAASDVGVSAELL